MDYYVRITPAIHGNNECFRSKGRCVALSYLLYLLRYLLLSTFLVFLFLLSTFILFAFCVALFPLRCLSTVGAAPYHCFEFWSGAYTRRWAAPVEQSKIGMTSSAFSSDGQAHPPEERYLLELGTRAYPSRTKVKDNLDRRSSSYVGDSNPGSNSGHRESVDVYQGMKVSSHGSLLYAVRPVAYATSDAESPPSSSAAVNDKRRTGTATAVRALPSFVGSDIHFRFEL